MDITKYISVDPNICHGKPCFKGTRVMVYLVLQLLAAGETPDDIIKNAYPSLNKKHIIAALRYAGSLAEEGRVVEHVKAPYAVYR